MNTGRTPIHGSTELTTNGAKCTVRPEPVLNHPHPVRPKSCPELVEGVSKEKLQKRCINLTVRPEPVEG
ncbi:MAG: hypothetical protein OQJ95_02820 [Kangiella sp.]|nr:hypothetical protein [Kangiella sp.]